MKFLFLLSATKMSLKSWLRTHDYSAGDYCADLQRDPALRDLDLKVDMRAFVGKWIVVTLAIFHLIKEFFQVANVS